MPAPSGSEKLRTTCDSCAASKVRCSKQKPRCHRCRCLQLDCVYGRSQRKGRPPASERSRSSTITRTSPSHMDSVQNLHPTYWGSLHNIFDVSRDYPTASDNDDMNLDDFLNDSDWVSANLIPGTEDRDSKIINPLVDNNVATAKQTHPLSYHNSISNDSSSDTTDLGLRFNNFNTELCTASRPDPINVGSDTSYSDPFCLNKALNIIQELYQLSICHSLLERDTNPTSDRVLKTNRQAVQTLESLFSCSCSTCCNDLNMPFLLSTIACKVLGWYRAVYYGDIVQPVPSQESSNQEEIVSMTRITIGDFQLDRGAETRMKAQLLLCELQSFGKVLDVLVQRNRCRSTDVKITESGVHEAFEQFLRGSLDDLVAKLDGCCVGKTL